MASKASVARPCACMSGSIEVSTPRCGSSGSNQAPDTPPAAPTSTTARAPTVRAAHRNSAPTSGAGGDRGPLGGGRSRWRPVPGPGPVGPRAAQLRPPWLPASSLPCSRPRRWRGGRPVGNLAQWPASRSGLPGRSAPATRDLGTPRPTWPVPGTEPWTRMRHHDGDVRRTGGVSGVRQRRVAPSVAQRGSGGARPVGARTRRRTDLGALPVRRWLLAATPCPSVTLRRARSRASRSHRRRVGRRPPPGRAHRWDRSGHRTRSVPWTPRPHPAAGRSAWCSGRSSVP
jgi:hypothetical protein